MLFEEEKEFSFFKNQMQLYRSKPVIGLRIMELPCGSNWIINRSVYKYRITGYNKLGL
jgi:hypothetical protein